MQNGSVQILTLTSEEIGAKMREHDRRRNTVRINRIACAVGILFAAQLNAELYKYYPSSALSLGAGFDPASPYITFLPCIDFDSAINVDTSGAARTDYAVDIVKSRSDLFNYLNISSSISANYTFFSADASFSLEDSAAFHSDSLVWIVRASTNFGRYRMSNPHLKPEAAAFIAAKDYDAFRQRCGPDYIGQESRGVLVAAIYSITNLSSDLKTRLTASLQASMSDGLFSTDLKSKYESFFHAATSVSTLKVQFVAVGGGGIRLLDSLIGTSGDTSDLSTMQTTLQRYLRSFDASNAVPVEFLSGSMTQFGWRGQDPSTLERDRVLSELYDAFVQIRSEISRLREIVATSDVRYSFLSPQKTEILLNQLTERQEAARLLYTVAQECRVNEHSDKCKVPPPLTVINWPLNPGNPEVKVTAVYTPSVAWKAEWLKSGFPPDTPLHFSQTEITVHGTYAIDSIQIQTPSGQKLVEVPIYVWQKWKDGYLSETGNGTFYILTGAAAHNKFKVVVHEKTGTKTEVIFPGVTKEEGTAGELKVSNLSSL